jgi:hypothetical protein
MNYHPIRRQILDKLAPRIRSLTSMKPQIKVRFNDAKEFTEELHRSVPNVESMVRVTKEFRPSEMTPTIQHVSVLATYFRLTGNVLQITELRKFCGEVWYGQDEKALDYANGLVTDLTNTAKSIGLEVGAGVYEPFSP